MGSLIFDRGCFIKMLYNSISYQFYFSLYYRHYILLMVLTTENTKLLDKYLYLPFYRILLTKPNLDK